MSEEPPQISILDARLAEIDRRLRSIQTELVPESHQNAPGQPASAERAGPPRREPAPPDPAPRGVATAEMPPRVEVPEPGPAPRSDAEAAPPPPGVSRPVAAPGPADAPGFQTSGSETPAPGLAELGAELRRIVEAQSSLLASIGELVSAFQAAVACAGQAESPAALREFSVAAGPFSSTEALRDFERTLSQIPEVREVEVRGYEGEDRAIVDVQLFDSRP